jgi:MFS family permease
MSQGSDDGGRRAVVRRALRNPRVRRVLVAYLIFNVAEWASWIALLVWAYGRGGVQATSGIALVQLLPGALLATPSAALLDRLSRARALTTGYLCQAVTSVALGAALVLDASTWLVAVLAALASVAITLTRPVHNALLPEVSRTTGDLTAGNAISGSLEAAATFAGPLLSGLLTAAWGPGGVLLAVGAGTAVGAALTATVRSAPPVPAACGASRARPVRTVVANPAARLMALLVGAEFTLVGMADILLVVLALQVLHMSSAGPGILNSALGVGGLIGAGFTFVMIGRGGLAPALVIGAVAAGLAFALAGELPSAPLVMVLVAVSGAGKLFYDVSSRTFVQRLLPDHLLTAMFAVQESSTMVGIAVGAVAAPLLVGSLGPQLSFVAAGALLPVVALIAFGRLRRLDAAAVVPLEVLALLREVPVLAVLAPRRVERMARDSVPVVAPAGTLIVETGEPGDLFYVIASGTVMVTMDGTVVRELGPGGWFGELALLHDIPRTATITALSEVRMWALDRESFLTAVQAVPQSRSIADSYASDHYRY